MPGLEVACSSKVIKELCLKARTAEDLEHISGLRSDLHFPPSVSVLNLCSLQVHVEKDLENISTYVYIVRS